MTPPNGVMVTKGFTSSTNYAAPSTITADGKSVGMSWADSLIPTGGTGMNQETWTTVYDG
jgi:hypothetical protein